jgi:hypothetical protein
MLRVFQLKSGMAEVFGTELVKGKSYVFTTGAKIAVFTWQGCVIELRGKTDVSYVAKETPMVSDTCTGTQEFVAVVLVFNFFSSFFCRLCISLHIQHWNC